MHLSEGVVSTGIISSGLVLAVAGTAYGLKQIKEHEVMQTSLLCAVFFVGSLIHIPLGPVSIHLTLNGLSGFFAGWGSFPAILTGLLLQALLFQHGGLSTLGINTVNLAVPAVLCWYLLPFFLKKNSVLRRSGVFICGFLSVFLAVSFISLELFISNKALQPVSWTIFITGLPLMIIEGMICMFTVEFLYKVKPELITHLNHKKIPTGENLYDRQSTK